MVGSKQLEPRVIIDGSVKKGPATLDDICEDRRYVERGQVLEKAEQPIDDVLESVVNGEIIPRLMLLHQNGAAANGHVKRGLTEEQLAAHSREFARLVVSVEIDVLTAYVNALLHKGVEKSALLLNLFAPAARRLGEMWESDEIDFVDVTIGTSKLQQLLHEISWEIRCKADSPARRVLLLPTPSEQHTFGLVMVGDFFRKGGWEVTFGPQMSAEQMSGVLREQWFSIVGFSLSCESLLGPLASAIKAARQSSRNRGIRVFVGGSIFANNGEVGRILEADKVCADPRDAVALAQTVRE